VVECSVRARVPRLGHLIGRETIVSFSEFFDRKFRDHPREQQLVQDLVERFENVVYWGRRGGGPISDEGRREEKVGDAGLSGPS